MKAERNWGFDYLKGISCIVVVLLHCPLPGIVGELVIYAFRFSVPIFFMISGYYSVWKSDEWIRSKALRLTRMLWTTEVFYFLWYLLRKCVIEREEPAVALREVSALSHPLRTILCGSFFNGTLWYLYAIVWTYVLLLFLRKTRLFRRKGFRVCMIVLLLGIQIVGGYHVRMRHDIAEYIFLFRNAVTFGLPMTLLGGEIARSESRIRERLSLTGDLVILFLGNLMIVAEYIVSGIYMDFHFSTLVVSVGMVLFAITFRGEKVLWKRKICYMGRELSMWIYLLHYFFITLLEEFPQTMWLKNVKALLVCGSSVLGAFLCHRISVRMKKREVFFPCKKEKNIIQ
jgi:fucose 4-O-acetylase-like acetyltransferase